MPTLDEIYNNTLMGEALVSGNGTGVPDPTGYAAARLDARMQFFLKPVLDAISTLSSGGSPIDTAGILAAIADLKAKKPIFSRTYKDNTGKVVLDKTYDNYDPYLDRMNYLLDGIVGSII